MHDLQYPDVHVELQSAIPELTDQFEKESWVTNDPGGAREYLVVELILNPLLRQLLDGGGDSVLLKRVFAFLERMATSSDPRVRNLLAVGVFEQLVSQPARISVAWQYMGTESRELVRGVARGLRREENLPRA